MKKRIGLLAALVLFALLGRATQMSAQLCYVVLLSADDHAEQELAESISQQFPAAGYQVKVSYCDNMVDTQLRQIETFLSLKPAVMIVHCNGNNATYEGVFRKAQENGVRVVALDIMEEMSFCDIMVKDYPVFQGVRMCEQLTYFLDKNYPDAEERSVDVLFLECSSNLNDIYIGAGYKLIQEKYLRYFDVAAMEFVREDRQETVCYYDENMQCVQVDEPVGGLILDQNGYAQRNPYYDPRVCLRYATSRNVISNQRSQNVVDAYMATEDGPNVRIIVAQNGEAAIGAAERLMYYHKAGLIEADISRIAVFGSGDTPANRQLVMDSLEQESVFRGFVCGENVDNQVRNILFMLYNGETGIYHSVSSSRSVLLPSGAFGLASVASNSWADPDMFYKGRSAE